jgi:hypothetical protein
MRRRPAHEMTNAAAAEERPAAEGAMATNAGAPAPMAQPGYGNGDAYGYGGPGYGYGPGYAYGAAPAYGPNWGAPGEPVYGPGTQPVVATQPVEPVPVEGRAAYVGDRYNYGSPGYNYGYGYYLDAPAVPYVPWGGNSGGANFPHSGT